MERATVATRWNLDLLEDYYAKTIGGKFLGHDAASGAGADDYEINFVGSFIFRRVDSHALVFSASGGVGCQPA